MSAFSDLPVQVIVQHIFPMLSGNDFKAWRLLDKQHHALVGQACRSLHRVHRTHPITAKLAAAFPSLTALNLSENEDVEAGPSFYHALAGKQARSI